MQQPPPHPQPPQMIPPQIPAHAITTEQIQKRLDENKGLILAILEHQNLGKLAECAEYQARLQQNLMFLAAIADCQPHPLTMPSQMLPHPAMQQRGQYMQHPQAVLPQQPPIGFPPKSPLQFNYQQMQMQEQQRQQLQYQQALQGQMGVQTGPYSGMQGIYTEGDFGGISTGGLPLTGGFIGGGLPSTGGFTGGPSTSGGDLSASTSSPEGKQDGAEAGSAEGEESQMKGSEDTK